MHSREQTVVFLCALRVFVVKISTVLNFPIESMDVQSSLTPARPGVSLTCAIVSFHPGDPEPASRAQSYKTVDIQRAGSVSIVQDLCSADLLEGLL